MTEKIRLSELKKKNPKEFYDIVKNAIWSFKK